MGEHVFFPFNKAKGVRSLVLPKTAGVVRKPAGTGRPGDKNSVYFEGNSCKKRMECGNKVMKNKKV